MKKEINAEGDESFENVQPDVQPDEIKESAEAVITGDELSKAMAAEFGDTTTDEVLAFEAAEAAGTAAPEEAQSETAFVAVEQVLPSELEEAQAKSIIESLLFAAVHPISFAQLKSVFYSTNINSDKLRDIIIHLQTDLAGGERGMTLEEVAGGYQLRTKADNSGWLRKLVKARPFKLSGPALEVLSIVAYKQPIVKAEIDEIRGVESSHLLRALMEKNIVKFAGKSELPGKPMLYATTKQFLELFGLRNIRELPTLNEIDKLIPEGIGEMNEIEGETLGSLADKIALAPGASYSDSETELLSITEALTGIATSTEFFEQEKIRERERRDNERAQDLRERQIVGEDIPDSDLRWLARFDAKIETQLLAAAAAAAGTVSGPADLSPAGAPEAAALEEPVTATPSVEPGHDVASHAAAAAAAFALLDDDSNDLGNA